jgi:hypothetical protein
MELLPAIVGLAVVDSINPSALLATIGVAALARLVTYRPFADTSWPSYLQSVVTALVVAGAAWALVRVQVSARSVLPWIAAVGVLIPGDVVHYLRVSHPLTHTREYVLSDDFEETGSGEAPAEALWLPELEPGAAVRVTGGRMIIRTPAEVTGFVGLRLRAGIDDATAYFWLPRGAFAPPTGEVLEWEAGVQRDNQLSIMLEVRTALFEATPYGRHVVYRELDGRLSGAEIEWPSVADGTMHRFRLERTDEHPLQRLLIDGQVAWTRPKPPGEWEFARFGATRSGPEHGGTLTLDNVRYTRLYDRT